MSDIKDYNESKINIDLLKITYEDVDKFGIKELIYIFTELKNILEKKWYKISFEENLIICRLYSDCITLGLYKKLIERVEFFTKEKYCINVFINTCPLANCKNFYKDTVIDKSYSKSPEQIQQVVFINSVIEDLKKSMECDILTPNDIDYLRNLEKLINLKIDKMLVTSTLLGRGRENKILLLILPNQSYCEQGTIHLTIPKNTFTLLKENEYYSWSEIMNICKRFYKIF